MQKVSPANHLAFLDGIRGGAALWVLLAHCMIWGGWYWRPLPSAKIAVDVFMVVSGFLMVFQYRVREAVEPIDQWRTTCRFWLRRFFRIAPLYYAFLLFLVLFWGAYTEGWQSLRTLDPSRWAKPSIYDPAHHRMDVWNVLMHVTFLFGAVPAYAFSNLSPDWSIGLEMQFYAVFPVLYLCFRRVSWIATVAAGVGLAVAVNAWFARLPGVLPHTKGLFPEPSFLFMKLPLFLIGMLCAEVFCRKPEDNRARLPMAVAALAVSVTYSKIIVVMTAFVLTVAWLRYSPPLDGFAVECNVLSPG
ncbi:MAG TPA: acyltransferase [Methylomirabilota bacterium]|nr:acyltransferase [Methylomirabilota bacterium]